MSTCRPNLSGCFPALLGDTSVFDSRLAAMAEMPINPKNTIDENSRPLRMGAPPLRAGPFLGPIIRSFDAEVYLLFDHCSALFFAQLVVNPDLERVIPRGKLPKRQSAASDDPLRRSALGERPHRPGLAAEDGPAALHYSDPQVQLSLGFMPFRGRIINDKHVLHLTAALESALRQRRTLACRFRNSSPLVSGRRGKDAGEREAVTLEVRHLVIVIRGAEFAGIGFAHQDSHLVDTGLYC